MRRRATDLQQYIKNEKPAFLIHTGGICTGTLDKGGIDQKTGIIKEKYHLGAPVFSTVAVAGNSMIVCDFAGNVNCLSSEK